MYIYNININFYQSSTPKIMAIFVSSLINIIIILYVYIYKLEKILRILAVLIFLLMHYLMKYIMFSNYGKNSNEIN